MNSKVAVPARRKESTLPDSCIGHPDREAVALSLYGFVLSLLAYLRLLSVELAASEEDMASLLSFMQVVIHGLQFI